MGQAGLDRDAILRRAREIRYGHPLVREWLDVLQPVWRLRSERARRALLDVLRWQPAALFLQEYLSLALRCLEEDFGWRPERVDPASVARGETTPLEPVGEEGNGARRYWAWLQDRAIPDLVSAVAEMRIETADDFVSFVAAVNYVLETMRAAFSGTQEMQERLDWLYRAPGWLITTLQSAGLIQASRTHVELDVALEAWKAFVGGLADMSEGTRTLVVLEDESFAHVASPYTITVRRSGP